MAIAAGTSQITAMKSCPVHLTTNLQIKLLY